MSSISTVILSSALALVSAGARAADPSAPSSGSTATEKLQEVTVTAQRRKLMPRVQKFVNQIVTPENDGEDGIARWQVPPMCPLVSGLTGQQGEFILERLSKVARDAAVPLAGEHCRPNLYILVTDRPEELLRGMEKRNRAFTFGYDASHYPLLETPPNIVDEFIKTPRAIRVWYNSDEKDPWGLPLTYCRLSDVLPGSQKIQQIYVRCGHARIDGGHVAVSAMTTFSRVFVIVDRSRMRGVTFGQLAAYVAMVGLARLKPDANLRDAPTILKLFNGAPHAAPAGLTDWDQAFLKSLYTTQQLAKGQSGQIARAMVRDILP